MSQGHLYCEKHQEKMGAAGCIKCIMDKLTTDGPGFVGGGLDSGSAAGSISVTYSVNPGPVTADKRRKDREFFEKNKAYHEKLQKERGR